MAVTGRRLMTRWALGVPDAAFARRRKVARRHLAAVVVMRPTMTMRLVVHNRDAGNGRDNRQDRYEET
jgi:hypothetical protein